MTAESIQHPLPVNKDLLTSMGGLMVQVTPSEEMPLIPTQGSNPDDFGKLSPNMSARATAIAATVVKERFQVLSANLLADERDALRAQLREDSVRLLFKAFNLIQNTDEINADFSAAYRKTESEVNDMDRQKLIELADKYDEHPAIKVFDTLKNISSIKNDDLVFMRRTSLVLMASNDLQ